ncbi:MAG: hypothetical protein IT364_24065, partial [Candidatus Hydrogenedentes bacterium]|nr:hypothetical protein [Candidatus Hydrogenedentota bacterium]
YRPLARLGAPPVHQALLDLLLSSGNNQRMHIKTCIIDGVAGITGGRNIGNNYFNYSLHYNFKDRDVLVVGPAVAGMTASFDEYWSARQAVECRDLRDVAHQLEQGVTRSDPGREEIYCAPYFTTLDAEADDEETVKRKLLALLAPAGRVAYVADAPGRKRRFFTGLGNNGRVTDALHELFEEARDSVVIQSPYVVVNRRLARFFRRVSEDKPDLRVTISTNSYGAADHLVTYAANYRLRPRVALDHGMEVFEYKPYPDDFLTYLSNAAELEAMAKAEGIERRPYLSIHAKTFVFDEDTTFIGTMNLDPRSFYLNSEDGFIIEDTAIAQRVRAAIERDMAPGNSWTIAANRRPIFLVNRVLERISARTPIDFWPLRSTSGFELRPGKEPISSEHPDFYKHYKDIGNFPGGEGPSGAKFVVRFLKVFGKPTTPLL